jgi:hypothetical protein
MIRKERMVVGFEDKNGNRTSKSLNIKLGVSHKYCKVSDVSYEVLRSSTAVTVTFAVFRKVTPLCYP